MKSKRCLEAILTHIRIFLMLSARFYYFSYPACLEGFEISKFLENRAVWLELAQQTSTNVVGSICTAFRHVWYCICSIGV